MVGNRHSVTWFDKLLNMQIEKSGLTYEQALALVKRIAQYPAMYKQPVINKCGG